MIKVIHCKVGEPPAVVLVKQTLTALQELVSGYIEYLCVKRVADHNISFLVNEEGRLKGLPLNTVAFAKRPADPEGYTIVELHEGLVRPEQVGAHLLHGDIAFIAGTGEADVSLTDEEVAAYLPALSQFVEYEGQKVRVYSPKAGA